MRRIVIVLLALTVVGTQVHAGPDRFGGTPAAKAEFDKGKALESSNEWEQAALAYKRAWSLRSAISTSSDMVRPLRAVSRLSRAMTASSMVSVVFMRKTISTG
jgi:hypothetical protein